MARSYTSGTALKETIFDTDAESQIVSAVQTATETKIGADVATRRENYTLVTALNIIRRMETSAARNAVFAEIKKKNPAYRLVDAIYAMAGSWLLQPLVLFAYMLKCILSLGPFDDRDQQGVTIANFQNEHHAIARLMSLIPCTPIMKLSLKRCHILRLDQIRSAVGMIGAIARVFPFLSRIARSYDFMPAARIASGLAYYIRFSQLFAQHSTLGTAIVASNYSPEALGLAAAAHGAGRKVIYVNHAPVPANGAMVPPVLADCAVFYGDAIQKTYEKSSRCNADVAMIGQPGITRAMEWSDEIRQFGIFLTALSCPKAVEELVSTINRDHPDVQILIRNHPVALLESDFSDLKTRHKNVTVTIGTSLDEEIEACDMIFCGNSGVAMNVLRGGRPVAYIDALDRLAHDYCGFVEDGLVYEIKSWSSDLYPLLQVFYSGPAWHRVMQSYDASYNCDLSALKQQAAEKISLYFSPKPDQS